MYFPGFSIQINEINEKKKETGMEPKRKLLYLACQVNDI